MKWPKVMLVSLGLSLMVSTVTGQSKYANSLAFKLLGLTDSGSKNTISSGNMMTSNFGNMIGPNAGMGDPGFGGGVLPGMNDPGFGRGDPGLGMGEPGLGMGDPGLGMGDPGLGMGDPGLGMGGPMDPMGGSPNDIGGFGSAGFDPGNSLGGPGMDLGGPGMDLGGPGMDLGGAGMDLGGPGMDLGGPGMDLGGPIVDLGSPANSFSGQGFEMAGPGMDMGGTGSGSGLGMMDPGMMDPGMMGGDISGYGPDYGYGPESGLPMDGNEYGPLLGPDYLYNHPESKGKPNPVTSGTSAKAPQKQHASYKAAQGGSYTKNAKPTDHVYKGMTKPTVPKSSTRYEPTSKAANTEYQSRVKEVAPKGLDAKMSEPAGYKYKSKAQHNIASGPSHRYNPSGGPTDPAYTETTKSQPAGKQTGEPKTSTYMNGGVPPTHGRKTPPPADGIYQASDYAAAGKTSGYAGYAGQTTHGRKTPPPADGIYQASDYAAAGKTSGYAGYAGQTAPAPGERYTEGSSGHSGAGAPGQGTGTRRQRQEYARAMMQPEYHVGEKPAPGPDYEPTGNRPKPGPGYESAVKRPTHGPGYEPVGKRPTPGARYEPAGKQPTPGPGYEPAGKRPTPGPGYDPRYAATASEYAELHGGREAYVTDQRYHGGQNPDYVGGMGGPNPDYGMGGHNPDYGMGAQNPDYGMGAQNPDYGMGGPGGQNPDYVGGGPLYNRRGKVSPPGKRTNNGARAGAPYEQPYPGQSHNTQMDMNSGLSQQEINDITAFLDQTQFGSMQTAATQAQFPRIRLASDPTSRAETARINEQPLRSPSPVVATSQTTLAKKAPVGTNNANSGKSAPGTVSETKVANFLQNLMGQINQQV